LVFLGRALFSSLLLAPSGQYREFWICPPCRDSAAHFNFSICVWALVECSSRLSPRAKPPHLQFQLFLYLLAITFYFCRFSLGDLAESLPSYILYKRSGCCNQDFSPSFHPTIPPATTMFPFLLEKNKTSPRSAGGFLCSSFSTPLFLILMYTGPPTTGGCELCSLTQFLWRPRPPSGALYSKFFRFKSPVGGSSSFFCGNL